MAKIRNIVYISSISELPKNVFKFERHEHFETMKTFFVYVIYKKNNKNDILT